MMLLIACLVMAAEGYFLPPLGPAQPNPLRGQPQGNADFYPEFNKIEENLNYNNRFLYQSPNYQHFSDSQRYYSQQAAAAQQAYGPPLQQAAAAQQAYGQPLQQAAAAQQAYGPPLQQLQYQQPEQLTEQVYSDIRDSPIYIQPHDEETTRQQSLTITPQYLNLPDQHPNAIPQPQQNYRGPQPGLHQTTAQTTIPVLVRVSDNQALIVPVRAVYALPGFLERLVQRVQGYYSVYNPIDNLVVDRPYFVPTTNTPVQPSLQVVANNADNSVDPMKADLVQDPALGSSESLSSEVASPALSTKVDLKQDEIMEETTTVAQPEEIKEGTTQSAEESNDSTEKEDSATESSETNDATTLPPSASADDSSSTAESSSTTESVSSTTESVSSTTEAVSSTTEGASTSKPEVSAEDNSDLESAGYTYYRPAVPFYYPSK